MLKTLSRKLLNLLGWTLIEPSEHPARAVLVGYPHTSNWDGVFALLAKLALGLDAHWVGKDSLFRWPLRSLSETGRHSDQTRRPQRLCR